MDSPLILKSKQFALAVRNGLKPFPTDYTIRFIWRISRGRSGSQVAAGNRFAI